MDVKTNSYSRILDSEPEIIDLLQKQKPGQPLPSRQMLAMLGRIGYYCHYALTRKSPEREKLLQRLGITRTARKYMCVLVHRVALDKAIEPDRLVTKSEVFRIAESIARKKKEDQRSVLQGLQNKAKRENENVRLVDESCQLGACDTEAQTQSNDLHVVQTDPTSSADGIASAAKDHTSLTGEMTPLASHSEESGLGEKGALLPLQTPLSPPAETVAAPAKPQPMNTSSDKKGNFDGHDLRDRFRNFEEWIKRDGLLPDVVEALLGSMEENMGAEFFNYAKRRMAKIRRR